MWTLAFSMGAHLIVARRIIGLEGKRGHSSAVNLHMLGIQHYTGPVFNVRSALGCRYSILYINTSRLAAQMMTPTHSLTYIGFSGPRSCTCNGFDDKLIGPEILEKVETGWNKGLSCNAFRALPWITLKYFPELKLPEKFNLAIGPLSEKWNILRPSSVATKVMF